MLLLSNLDYFNLILTKKLKLVNSAKMLLKSFLYKELLVLSSKSEFWPTVQHQDLNECLNNGL